MVHAGPSRCGAHFACASCRDRWANKLRRRFLRARTGALRLVGQRMRGPGAWSEKLLTLTIPHHGLAADRIRWVLDAWPHFLRRLRSIAGRALEPRFAAYSDRRPRLPKGQKSPRARAIADELRRVVWYRATEWTPGDDGEGHPHVHLYYLGPWLDQHRLREAWAASLAEVGLPVAHAGVDVRRPKGVKWASELIKYFTKDTSGTIEGGDYKSAPAESYATAYRLLAGKRRTQGARGFLALAGVPACSECQQAAGWDVEILRPPVWWALKKQLEALEKPGLARARAGPGAARQRAGVVA